MDSLRFSRILVGIDGSPLSFEACRVATGLARFDDTTLTLLHVASPISPGSTVNPMEYLRAETSARIHGAQILERAGSIVGAQVPFETEIAFGDPAGIIRQRAQELNVDLVVVGSRGLGTIDRLLLGSVSSSVASRAHCSVLVVRQGEMGDAVTRDPEK